MRKVLLSAVALAALSASAFAADLPSRKSAPVYMAPVSAYSWTGFYAGIEGGADFLNTKYDAVGFTNRDTAGLLGGVVGYNYQVNQFVLGLEGNAGGVFGGHTSMVNGGYLSTSSTYYADIRGRLGFAVDRALFYVAGGAAFGDVVNRYTGLGTSTLDRTGWTIGGGVDYAFTPNWIGRVEYRYTDLGSSWDGSLGSHVRNDSNAVLVGLMYKFGAPSVSSVVAKY